MGALDALNEISKEFETTSTVRDKKQNVDIQKLIHISKMVVEMYEQYMISIWVNYEDVFNRKLSDADQIPILFETRVFYGDGAQEEMAQIFLSYVDDEYPDIRGKVNVLFSDGEKYTDGCGIMLASSLVCFDYPNCKVMNDDVLYILCAINEGHHCIMYISPNYDEVIHKTILIDVGSVEENISVKSLIQTLSKELETSFDFGTGECDVTFLMIPGYSKLPYKLPLVEVNINDVLEERERYPP